ncbi:hypothetical protein ACF0H5_018252 [Mactra antiquata]
MATRTRNKSPMKGGATTPKQKEQDAAKAAAKARALRKTNSPVKEPKGTDAEEFIRCELCRHMLDDPKSLACMHSFCRQCLLTYAKETCEKDPSKSLTIVCPICRQTTASTQSGITLEKWINQLPTNEFLRSYLEAVNLKDPKRKCDTCSRQNKVEIAEQWCGSCHDALCEDCVGFHNALTTTKGHRLTLLSKIRAEPIENIITMPLCRQHDGENVTKYCGIHRDVVCEKCVAESHKGCRDVKLLKEAASRSKPDVNRVNKMLDDEVNLAKSIQENREKAERSIDTDQDNVLETIYQVRKKINENLTKCEEQIINELGDIHGREKAKITSETKEAQRLRKSSGNLHGLVTSSEKYGTESHVLQNLPQASQQSEFYREKVAALNSRIRTSKITFHTDPVLESLMRGIGKLGELKVTSSSAQLPSTLNVKSMRSDSDPEDERDMKNARRPQRSSEANITVPSKPVLSGTFSGRTPSDTEACWFTGITCLPNGQVVLVDRNNSKLKLFGTDHKLITELDLQFQPYGITLVSACDIAVSLPRENKIHVYNVGTTFRLVQAIPTSDRGYGISYAEEKFVYACACASPPSIKVTTRDGVDKQEICPDDNFHPMFFRPWYVKLNKTGTFMYVSDCHRSHVTCISGTVMKQFQYTDSSLNSPRGLHVTKDGRIIVCGFGSDNIQLLSKDGVYICELLARGDSVMGPHEVALTDQEDKMIITFDPSNGKSDVVHVYRVNL